MLRVSSGTSSTQARHGRYNRLAGRRHDNVITSPGAEKDFPDSTMFQVLAFEELDEPSRYTRR